MTDDLNTIADEIAALSSQFVDVASSGLVLPTRLGARFNALAIEARAIVATELRPTNEFSLAISSIISADAMRAMMPPSRFAVEEVEEVIRSAARTISRKARTLPASSQIVKNFVDLGRIHELQTATCGEWDFKRLVELCRELNVVAEHRCYMSTAMLVRAILDHIPPVLGFETFAQVASNYGGPKSQKSFKGSMQHLQQSLRNIADTHLHSPIRRTEVVPSAVQVDFAADLDVLLGEVIRVSQSRRVSHNV